TPESGTAPLEVTFDATTSSDPDGSITSYEWSFGDGATGSGAQTTRTYLYDGTYIVTLTVTDDAGAKAQATAQVAITLPPNQPPTAAFTVTPETGDAPLEVTLDASASSDPDGSIASYAWDLGDGTIQTGAQTTHTYELVGEYVITLEVTDDAGATTTATGTVRVDAPEPIEMVVDPVFTIGIVAGGNIATYMRGEAEMTFWAGGNLEATGLTLGLGHTAQAAGATCRLRGGICNANVEPPVVPAPDFPRLRAAVIENVLDSYGATDLADICDHNFGEGPSRASADARVVCLAPGQDMEIQDDFADLIVIGDETTRVEVLRGTLGGEEGTVVIVSGTIEATSGIVFVGDVSLITAQAMKRLGATFLSNASGARPLVASEGDITINQSGETHALVWTGGTFTTAGDRSEFVGTAVVAGDYI